MPQFEKIVHPSKSFYSQSFCFTIVFDFYLGSKYSSYLIKSNSFFLFVSLLSYIVNVFKNKTDGNSRLTTAWNRMTDLVTTLIVFTQNFIPLKRFSSVVNVISLIASCAISKTKLIRCVFA